MNYIIFLAIFQSLFAIVLLPIGRQKRPANELLRWFLACIFIHMLLKFLIFTTVDNVEIRRSFNTFIGLAYGPLLWMYARKVRDERYNPRQHWLCLVPSIVSAFVYLFVAIYIMIYNQQPVTITYWYNTITSYAIIASFIYPILTLSVVKSLASFWSIERKLVNQLAGLLLFFGIEALVGLLLSFVPGVDMNKIGVIIRVASYAGLLLSSVAILKYEFGLYKLLAQDVLSSKYMTPEIAEQPSRFIEEIIDEPAQIDAVETPVAAAEEFITTNDIVRKQLLNEQQRVSLMHRLTALMDTKKPFTDHELSLEKLAALLQIPRNQASELINQCTGKSFYQFINEYRIQEVIAMLDKCHKLNISPNILSIAFDAGFHSKSSFNVYFKKVTGHTPSSYLKKDKPVYGAEEQLIWQNNSASQFC